MSLILVEVMNGKDRTSAKPLGDYHFARTPSVGDRLEIDDLPGVVVDAWHKPSPYAAGSKFAVCIESPA